MIRALVTSEFSMTPVVAIILAAAKTSVNGITYEMYCINLGNTSAGKNGAESRMKICNADHARNPYSLPITSNNAETIIANDNDASIVQKSNLTR